MRRVVGIGQREVPLGRDVRTGKPSNPFPEARGKPFTRDGVVSVVGGGAEERTVPDVVQNRCEQQLIVRAVGVGEVSGLQGMVELVDGLLVPYPAQ